jgi:hypothetical protein
VIMSWNRPRSSRSNFQFPLIVIFPSHSTLYAYNISSWNNVVK